MSIRKFLAVLLFLILFTGSNQAASVSVLCYHSFLGIPKYAYDFSNQELRAQLNFFIRNGFRFVSYDDILKNKVTGNRNLLVTIDDGNISAYRAYTQVFKPYKIKPVFAIYPAIVSKGKYAMNWWQLKELMKDGCEITSHGYNHLFVAQKLYDRDPTAFKREIDGSKEFLEKVLRRKINIFIYPFGVHSTITLKTVRNTGYHYAYGLTQRPMQLPLSHNPNSYDLPRYMFTRSNWRKLMPRIVKEALELEPRVVHPVIPTQNSLYWLNKI